MLPATYDFDSTSNTFTFYCDKILNVKLINKGLAKIEAMPKCFYFQYEFDENIGLEHRKDFIEFIQFPKKENRKNLEQFVRDAVDALHITIDLYNFDTIIFPKVRSLLTQETIEYIFMFNHPDCLNFEDLKTLNHSDKFKKLLKPKILLIDDFISCKTALNSALETIKTLNPDSEIVVFSLISKTTIARLHNPSD